MLKEIWKKIDGFAENYQVSNLGRIKSVKRTITYTSTNQTGVEFEVHKYVPERIIKTYVRGGYEHVGLKKHSKTYNYTVHRLVAEHFISNPHHYTIINHKDENKFNNRADNLEWCTSKYNANYGTRNQRIAEKLKDNDNYYIPVLCYDLNNNFVKRYESAEQAGKEVGISGSGIIACCRLYHGRMSAGGYKWKYEKSNICIEDVIYESQKKFVHQFDLEGNYITTFESLSAGARVLGKNVQNFTTALKKGLAYGHIWVVGNDYKKINNLLIELYEKQHHIYQIDFKGNIVNKFKSGLEVEEKLGLNHSNISHCTHSKTKEGKLFRKGGDFYWVDINIDPNYEIDYNFQKGHGEIKVIQCDLNGNELREFDSIRDAQEFLKIDRNKSSAIYDCFKPNTKKKSAYGYIWKKR